MQSALRRIFLISLSSLFPALLFCAPAKTKNGAAAASGTTPAEPVIQLETIVVTAKTELPPPEDWLSTKIRGFTVYSNSSERASKKLLRDFETFRLALDNVWPIKATIRRPGTIIFCGRNGFDEFIPRSDRADFSKDSGRASTTLIGPDHAYIVIDMSTSTMTLNNTDIDIDTSSLGATFEVDYYRLLYREYVHYMLSQSDAPPPVWYEEGILQIIQKMEVYPKYIRIGEIKSAQSGKSKPAIGMPTASTDEEDDSGVSDTGDDAFMAGAETISDTDFNIALQRRRLLNFKEFFGVTPDSPLARNPIGNNVWAKQCYAFVHMCLYGLPNRYKKSLETLVARSAKEPMTEELFQECFGKPYKKILIELRGYIDFTAYQFNDYVVQGKDRIDEPAREFTIAPEADSAKMKADALMLANNAGPALPALRGAYGRGARDPEFLATYGLAARATNQDELARRMLSQAIAGKTKRSAAYPAYANLLLADAKAHPAAQDGVHITPVQLAQILDVLFPARQLRPLSVQTYRTIADAWLACAVEPKPENFTVITEGLTIFPADRELVYLSARLALRMHNERAANALIEHGLKISRDDAERARFNDLKPMLANLAADNAVRNATTAN